MVKAEDPCDSVESNYVRCKYGPYDRVIGQRLYIKLKTVGLFRIVRGCSILICQNLVAIRAPCDRNGIGKRSVGRGKDQRQSLPGSGRSFPLNRESVDRIGTIVPCKLNLRPGMNLCDGVGNLVGLEVGGGGQ